METGRIYVLNVITELETEGVGKHEMHCPYYFRKLESAQRQLQYEEEKAGVKTTGSILKDGREHYYGSGFNTKGEWTRIEMTASTIWED